MREVIETEEMAMYIVYIVQDIYGEYLNLNCEEKLELLTDEIETVEDEL
jgi:hypothetical protein